MAFEFSDDQVFSWVSTSVNKYRSIYKKNELDSLNTFIKNPDPFHLITKMISLHLNKEEVLKPIPISTTDKTYLNFQGEQWEELILMNQDWERPKRLLDVSRKDKTVVVELKNKHNTVKGSDKVNNYDQMKICIDEDGYSKALFVFMIPKGTKPTYKSFTPSDNKTNSNRPKNTNLIEVDGKTFFDRYFFETNNGFSNFINQVINVSENFSDVYKNNTNLTFLNSIRQLYDI